MRNTTHRHCELHYLVLIAVFTLSASAVFDTRGAGTLPSEQAAWALLETSKDPEIVALRTLLSSLERDRERAPAAASKPPRQQLAIQRLEQRIGQLEREVRLMRGDIARLKRGL